MARNLKKIGVCIVLLIGGEPFVRKDIHEIVECFTKRNIHVRLQTNGVATKEQLELCVKNGAKDISISLDTLESAKQDKINGGFEKTWEKAIKAIANVNETFPERSTAFFNTVIMPRNLKDIPNVIKFATEIGWGVSLVPVHITNPTNPMGYRTIFDNNYVTFSKNDYEDISKLINDLKILKRKGFNLYDSDRYLDDIENFLINNKISWREKNNDVCDSPGLYFAISPSGALKACCDHEINNTYYVYDESFVNNFFNGKIHNDVYKITNKCNGCMYGSYPEITISSRYYSALVERIQYFNIQTPKIKKINEYKLKEIALEILNGKK